MVANFTFTYISNTMKIYIVENTNDFQRMILFVNIFANVKCFGFYTFIRALLNEMEKRRKF